MKTLALVVVTILIISSSTMLGFHWSGGANNGWQNEPNEDLNGTLVFKVYQWCDAQINSVITLVDIKDYDTEYIYDPDSGIYQGQGPNFIAKIWFSTNAKSIGISVDTDLTKNSENFDSFFKVNWMIYVYEPGIGYLPPFDNGEPVWKDLGDLITINSENLLVQDGMSYPNFGLGFKFKALKNLPAGEYTLKYYVSLIPTVVF